ncbi:hypothetical protein [uncultured Parasutterella sp.]|uniref:hypothetical protein n=1 Tax=uncultured Parasutterella sp. TaxID=1263098 RepID=UPI0025F9BECA|nr:hypothetical protein [uncultured Parasutterella sp.]
MNDKIFQAFAPVRTPFARVREFTNLFTHVDRFLFVNLDGKRFIKEDARRDVLRDAMLDQPKAIAWTIVDADGFRRTPKDLKTKLH